MTMLNELQYGQYETVEHDDYSSRLYIDFHNKRFNLLRYTGNLEKLIKNTVAICSKYDIGKILVTVPHKDVEDFIKHGFVQEAVIGGYFKGKTGYNVSYFHDKRRAYSRTIKEEDEIIEKVKGAAGQFEPMQNSPFSFRTAQIEDAETMAKLYEDVFKTYPTPMHKPEYIRSVIEKNQVYFKVAEYDNQIVSAASADLNHEYLNAEITDCATNPDFRRRGLLSELVYHLEKALKEMNFMTLFSVARAISPGINTVFSKHSYQYSGRQINNSNIMGELEDMNIWVKRI